MVEVAAATILTIGAMRAAYWNYSDLVGLVLEFGPCGRVTCCDAQKGSRPFG